MKHQSRNRILSLFLCAAVAVTVLLLCVFAVTNEEFAVTYHGEIAEKVVFRQDEKTELALQGMPDGAELQWQIRMTDGEAWVDITGQTEDKLTLSYALVASIMDQTGSTAVRCCAMVNGEEAVTAPVEVQMSFVVDSSLSQAPLYTQQSAATGGVMLLAETTYVEIRIEYVDEAGNAVFDPYVAYLVSGDPFEATVNSPSKLGYGAYMDGATPNVQPDYTYTAPNAATVDLEYTSVTEDTTITVTYYKIPVPYAVRYFLQNVNNDLYTESPDVYRVGKGLEGEYPDEDIEIEIPGFSPLYHQPATIAADGSTEFQVSYDRNYYLINFQLDGGYGVDPIYARYETHIVVPTPVKPGYVFAGWDLVSYEDADGTVHNCADGNANTLPSTMPARNETYQAIWTTVETTYTVVYWIDNGDNTKSYIGSKTVIAQSASEVNGTDDLSTSNICGVQEHTHAAYCYICGNLDHAHDGTCYSCELDSHADQIDQYILTCGHTHSTACCVGYTAHGGPSDYDKAAFSAIGDGEPESGYVYTINVDAGWDQNTYYYLYIDDIWYHVTNDPEWVDGASLGEGTYTRYDDLVYTARKYNVKLPCGHVHDGNCTHSSACFKCGLAAHSHSDDCVADVAPYVEFVKADTGITVEGDGSTVVNVNYTYKTYTIRYVYARKLGDTYYIATLTGDGQFSSCQWTGVGTDAAVLPTFTDPSGQTERPSFTVDDTTYYYISLSAKFGDDISAKWPSANIGDVVYRGTTYQWGSWAAEYGSGYRIKYGDAHANIVGPYPVMSEDMMVADRNEKLTDGTYLAQNMIAWWGSNQGIEAHAYHSYFEILPGTEKDPNETYLTYNGKEYVLKTDVFTAAHNGTTRVDPVVYAGFNVINEDKDKQANSNNYSNNGNCSLGGESHHYCNVFYYDRAKHALSFVNYNSSSTAPSPQTLMFGEPLTDYKPAVPAYPVGLEPDAYEFKGWYTTPECYDGTEVNWEKGTMPDGDLSLYAKWEPVDRKVYFYHTYDDMVDGTLWKDQYPNPVVVQHGQIMTTGQVLEPPPRDGYDFVGWFYMDETGTKKAFSLYEMEVRQDLKLYAEWHSGTYTEYIISYKGTYDAENEVILAPANHGYVLAGTTKTFTAKAGEELYPQYQTENGGMMWFPLTNSHSILMHRYEVGEDGTDVIPEANKYTFRYRYMAVPDYTVRYLDAQTGLPLASEKTVKGEDHKAAVVTEQFLYIAGYLPDAANKRLVLSAEASENVITFYYTKQTQEESVYYLVTHYIQNLGDNGYSEYTSYAKIGTFGDTVTAAPLAISGFAFDASIPGTVQTAKLEKPAEGAESYEMVHLKLYYVRNIFPYEVRYVRYDDHTVTVAETKTSDADLPYGTSVTEKAVPVQGFTVVGEATKTITIDARVQETDADGNKHYNIITFYYAEKKTDIYYYAVCTSPVATDFGHVSPRNELQVTNANIQGSKATAHSGFKFVGWYEDPTCTTAVSDKWLTEEGTKLKPVIEQDKMDPEYSFYALFEPVSSDLTITKTGVDADCTDNFIFHVKGTEGTVTEYVNLYITINGNGSVTIPDIYCGQYTITELGWSYEYTPDAAVKTVTTVENEANKVDFTNTYVGSDWLGDEDSVDNDFGTYTPPTT